MRPCRPSQSICHMKQRAFSLVELLFVMVIIAIVAALTLPAFNSMGKAQALSGAGSTLVDQLALARQTAVAQNRVVEVRFYKRRENPSQPASSANPARFRSYRTMFYDENVLNAFAQTTMQDLPTQIVLAEDRVFSTLIFPYTTTTPSRAFLRENISNAETNVDYQFIRFKPTGGTALSAAGTPDADRWFLTIKSDNDQTVGTGTSARPAHNYVTIMLDAVSGRVRTYRP